MSNTPNNDINNIIINYLKEKSESSCIPKGLKLVSNTPGLYRNHYEKIQAKSKTIPAKRKNKIHETQK